LIDLHTHTTASDGRCSPGELVARAVAAGVQVLGVTDHDTVAACEAAAAACMTAGVEFVPGIEITSILDGIDVHVLGYFVDPHSPPLLAFLAEQRHQRIERIRQMIRVLASHGIVLDADTILQPTLDDPSKSAGRPWIGRALVAAGHVPDLQEAFNQWLATGRPAFVPRAGASPVDVFSRIHAAGGLASLAHPGLLKSDRLISEFAAGGLDAIEAYHSAHDEEATQRYLDVAGQLGLLVTGGSDYHADDTHAPHPGSSSLPRVHYERLLSARRV
jgi:predicted metal-dependent phosphoesterase TrpH